MRSEPALLVGKTKHAFANWERTLTPNLGISVKESVTSDICDQKLSSPRSVDGSPDIGVTRYSSNSSWGLLSLPHSPAVETCSQYLQLKIEQELKSYESIFFKNMVKDCIHTTISWHLSFVGGIKKSKLKIVQGRVLEWKFIEHLLCGSHVEISNPYKNE